MLSCASASGPTSTADACRDLRRDGYVVSVVPMELLGVRLEVQANTPIVLLQESEGRRRVLPIYIGNNEAAAIAYALERVVPPRPLTHDLFRNVLEELGAALE